MFILYKVEDSLIIFILYILSFKLILQFYALD